MKRLIMTLGFGLLLFLATSIVAGTGEADRSFSLWLGGHYTDFQDYTKKVGEYKLYSDNFFPEFNVNYFSQSGSSIFRLDGHYFDYENAFGRLKTKTGDKFKAEFQYRSMTKQSGMDLLDNMRAREWLGDHAGGKYVTHEFLDNVTDFKTKRYELTSKAEVLLSRKNNIRLMAAHRMINENGNTQEIANAHCFNCHLGSQSAKVDKRTNSFKTGLAGDLLKQRLAYNFSYRKFESRAPETYFAFEGARHPVNGSIADELASRLNFEGESIPINGYPETEKTAHKISSKGKLGDGRYAAAFSYSRVKNTKPNFTNTELLSEAYNGRLNYTAPLSPKMRLVAKLGVGKINSTDPFIDIAPFREGRPGSENLPSFDYTRYSVLDRTTFDGTAEVITKVNPKMTLAILAGYNLISRDDYPVVNGDNNTKTMIGQVKFKYRQGLKYTVRAKYRFEKTSDPFVSAKGLFQRRGREELAVPSGLIYYYQLEGLRYHDITTEPTDKHLFDVKATARLNSQVNLLAGFKGSYDKNSDLDSIDVKHTMFQPNLNLTLTPNSKWVVTTGYSYDWAKSRGPITIALFDG